MNEMSRRTVLLGLTAAPVFELAEHANVAARSTHRISIVAEATLRGVDPIFATIERHRLALSSFEDVCYLVDEIAAREEGRVVTPIDYETYERASDREVQAMDALVSTAPTSFSGLLAALAYLSDFPNWNQALERFARTVTTAPPLKVG